MLVLKHSQRNLYIIHTNNVPNEECCVQDSLMQIFKIFTLNIII